MAAPSRRHLLLSSAALALLGTPAKSQPGSGDTEWRHYGGDLANRRYAPLAQIDAANFNRLQIAWRFKPDNFGSRPEYQFEATPLMVGGKIFTTAGSRRDVVCLDARTGEILWMHRYDEGERARVAPRQLSGHGVAYWNDGAEQRVLYVTPGYRLIALDARTGMRVPGFGQDGVVDLRLDDDQDMDLIHADIGLHSTPAIAKDVVIVGAAHDSGNVPKSHINVKGYVRGFDVRTGKRLWIFHTIPRKGEFGYESWTVPGQAENAGNTGCWAQISVDADLGLAYLPVELPTGDYNGQYRAGPALFGESIVAVDVQTGIRKWHYQTVHHGLWDRDIPCAPVLVDIHVNGKPVKALAQPTKQAFLYVLDRVTGKPVWPIVERPVEKGDVPGEWYSPTQPFPTRPPAYDVQGVRIDDLINFTPELRQKAVQLVANYKIGPLYTPPTMSTEEGTLGTLVAPGVNGGTDWPGGSFDPQTEMFYVYSQTGVGLLGMVKNPGEALTHSDFDYVHGTVASLPHQSPPSGSSEREADQRREAPAPRSRRRVSLNVDGLPLLKPPYGRITAIDLSKGSIAWQVAHGETPDSIRNNPALKGVKLARTGQPGIVGPLTTATLVICGDSGVFTNDAGVRVAMMRAYDKKTGEEKGAVQIPAPQTGAPMTYMLDGVQYLLVAIGGAGVSAELLAFRLPAA